MKRISFLTKIGSIILAGLVISSCYLPQRFDAEIEVDAAGYYSMSFDGYIVDVDFYQALQKGDMSEEKELEKIATIERDITRDSAVKEFEYFKQAHFRVKWERKGDLLKTRAVTFLRRSESMISLKYVAGTGLIEMMGRPLGKENKERLANMGLGMAGEIRLKTSLPPLDHNAHEIIDDKNDELTKWYVWRIKDIFQATPRILLKIE